MSADPLNANSQAIINECNLNLSDCGMHPYGFKRFGFQATYEKSFSRSSGRLPASFMSELFRFKSFSICSLHARAASLS